MGGGKQCHDSTRERIDTGAGDGGAEEHRMHRRNPGLVGEGTGESRRRRGGVPRNERGEQRIVVFGEHVREAVGEVHTVRGVWRECGGAGAGVSHAAHRDSRGCQPFAHLLEGALWIGACAVDLVDEEERGDAEALKRTHEHARLRLYTLDRGDDEHGAVEHAEDALHLGDEVRVTGRFDQIDGDVFDHERNDRGFDGDAAAAFECEGVCLSVAVVDAANMGDDARVEEQALGETGFTGVYMRQNAKIQGSQKASCPVTEGR